MNKYQKQALADLVKVAGIVLAGSLAVAALSYFNIPASDVVGAVSLVAMGYCVYQLYLLRVAQLESLDRLNDMERK
jgi:hypothetical protein